MRLSVKIILLFTALVTSIILVMGFIIYNVSNTNMTDDYRKLLRTRAARTAYFYNTFRTDSMNLQKSLDGTSPTALIHKTINIYALDGTVLYHFSDPESAAFSMDSAALRKLRFSETSFYKDGARDVCLLKNVAGPGVFIVAVAAENIGGEQYIANLRRIFFIYLPVALLFTIIIGYLFYRSVVRPVRQTIDDVQLITSQNLSHRLFVGSNKDELSKLNTTFNDLLDRLEESFAIQRRFISNASHELSTPLTSVSSQVEVALFQDRSPEEYRRVLQSVLEDVKELQQLTKTLLEIAKAGTHGTISLEPVRIDELLIKAHTETMRQNPGFSVDLAFAELPEHENECVVFGNGLLLQSACKNIMENGCKYSPDKSVHASLAFHGDKVEMIFRNAGDSIPPEELQRIFEPFYRGKNSEIQPGVGLGLTLTRKIIQFHKGSLDMESEAGQTTIRILLPTLQQ